MKQKFVDLFDVRRHGVNWLAAVGLFLGGVMGTVLWQFYWIVLRMIRFGEFETEFIDIDVSLLLPGIMYSLVGAIVFIGLAHILKSDFLFPFLGGALMVGWGIFYRGILIPDTPGISFPSAFDAEAIFMNFRYIFFYILLVVVLFHLFQRLSLAVLVGFPAAAVLSECLRIILQAIKGEPYSLELDSLVLLDIIPIIILVITPILDGALLYLGYRIHMRIKFGKQAPAAFVKKRLSRGFYLGSVIAYGLILLVSTLAVIVLAQQKHMEKELLVVAFAFWVLLLLMLICYIVIVFCRLVYKMWSFIQDGHARTTPGRAVGFLFIPFFSLYWIFQAIWGFAVDYNRYLFRYNIPSRPLSQGLFLTFVIICVIPWEFIPVVNFVLLPVHYILMLVVFSKICTAVNALPELPETTPERQADVSTAAPVPVARKKMSPGTKWAIIISPIVFVLIIMGILAAVAVPSLLEAREKAAIKQTRRDMRNIAACIESYQIDYLHPPKADDFGQLMDILFEENYIYKNRMKDAWGKPFIYKRAETQYVLISVGKNGILDTRIDLLSSGVDQFDYGDDLVFLDYRFVDSLIE